MDEKSPTLNESSCSGVHDATFLHCMEEVSFDAGVTDSLSIKETTLRTDHAKIRDTKNHWLLGRLEPIKNRRRHLAHELKRIYQIWVA
jgi:hypothetical protein